MSRDHEHIHGREGKTRKLCKFLDLPAELRNNIYEACYLLPRDFLDLTTADMYQRNLNLRLVSRQIHNECTSYLRTAWKAWETTVFFVDLGDQSNGGDSEYKNTKGKVRAALANEDVTITRHLQLRLSGVGKANARITLDTFAAPNGKRWPDWWPCRVECIIKRSDVSRALRRSLREQESVLYHGTLSSKMEAFVAALMRTTKANMDAGNAVDLEKAQ